MTTIHEGENAAGYFSRQAPDYAAYRPHYPRELFAYLASVVPAHALAWDCATGNGQAAVPLADHFARVVASDASASQLEHAVPHERVEYRVARADAGGLDAASADLVTVAQALHWFDLDAFFAEARRVLVPRGVLAVSSYGSATLDTLELTQIFSRFEWQTLGSYWPPRRRFVGDALRDLPFPFDELSPPHFPLEAQWNLEQLVGYARSWSATAQYVRQHGSDPTIALEEELRASWGAPAVHHTVRWPFVLRVGRVLRDRDGRT